MGDGTWGPGRGPECPSVTEDGRRELEQKEETPQGRKFLRDGLSFHHQSPSLPGSDSRGRGVTPTTSVLPPPYYSRSKFDLNPDSISVTQ